MILRRHFFAIFLAALLPFSASASDETVSVLFFGNSITYVGNLPAVFSALCAASDNHCSTQMVVQGGASLSDRVADKSLDRAVAKHDFDYLILQERGGDLIAFPYQAERRKRAEEAALSLVKAARRFGIEPVILGTYQGLPSASRALVIAESRLAADLNAAYVPVSNVLACGRSTKAGLRWFAEDGMHPGPELTLMMAVLLYHELFDAFPPVEQITVQAPIYDGVSSGLRADSFASSQPVLPGTASSIVYDADTVRAVVELTRTSCQ